MRISARIPTPKQLDAAFEKARVLAQAILDNDVLKSAQIKRLTIELAEAHTDLDCTIVVLHESTRSRFARWKRSLVRFFWYRRPRNDRQPTDRPS